MEFVLLLMSLFPSEVRIIKKEKMSMLSCLGRNMNWVFYGICIAFEFVVPLMSLFPIVLKIAFGSAKKLSNFTNLVFKSVFSCCIF